MFEIKTPKERLVACVILLIYFASWLKTGISVFPSPDSVLACPSYFESCFYYLQDFHSLIRSAPGEISPDRLPLALVLIPIEIGLIAAAMNKPKVLWWSLFFVLLMKAIPTFAFMSFILNFDYYDIAFLAVFLFARERIFYARIAFVVFYFLCSTIKFDSGWIDGGYFRTFAKGLPVLGDDPLLITLMTNLVIVMQIFLGWGLLFKSRKIRYPSLVFFSIFHIYSALAVGLRFPLSTIPLLVVLFVLDFDKDSVDISSFSKKIKDKFSNKILSVLYFPEMPKKSLFDGVVVSVLFFMFFFQVVKIAVPGDEKLSGEMNMVGFYMFDANHQCVTILEKEVGVDPSGLTSYTLVSQVTSSAAQNRCSVWERIALERRSYCWDKEEKEIVLNDNNSKLRYTHYASVNGKPLKEIVSRVPLCEVAYNSYGYNDWIHRDGYPGKEEYKVHKNDYGNRFRYDNNFTYFAETGSISTSMHQKKPDGSFTPVVDNPDFLPKNIYLALLLFYWIVFLSISFFLFRFFYGLCFIDKSNK